MMSWAEVGFISRAERATRGFDWRMVRPELLRASAGSYKVALAVGQAMEVARGLGVPATSCLHDPGSWALGGWLRDPESQGWKGPGHCVDEETEPRKREETHPGITQRGLGQHWLICSPRPVQSLPYPG